MSNEKHRQACLDRFHEIYSAEMNAIADEYDARVDAVKKKATAVFAAAYAQLAACEMGIVALTAPVFWES